MSDDLMSLILRILGAIGGIGVIIIGLSKLFGNILRDRLKIRAGASAKKEVELFKQQLGLKRIRADKFAEAQFTAYNELWKSLQDLRTIGESLWEKANQTNLRTFARQLRQTEARIAEGEIYFENGDYEELRELLDTFGRFEIGKTQLRKIRANTKLNENNEEIAWQIAQNRGYKEQYEALLKSVKGSFRNRLSSLEQD